MPSRCRRHQHLLLGLQEGELTKQVRECSLFRSLGCVQDKDRGSSAELLGRAGACTAIVCENGRRLQGAGCLYEEA